MHIFQIAILTTSECQKVMRICILTHLEMLQGNVIIIIFLCTFTQLVMYIHIVSHVKVSHVHPQLTYIHYILIYTHTYIHIEWYGLWNNEKGNIEGCVVCFLSIYVTGRGISETILVG